MVRKLNIDGINSDIDPDLETAPMINHDRGQAGPVLAAASTSPVAFSFSPVLTPSDSQAPAASVSDTDTVSFQGSGLVFVNSWGSGATAQFQSIVIGAESYLSQLFPNACTVHCTFDLQSLSPSFSGENSFNPIHVSYSSFVSALQQHAQTATGRSAATALSQLADPTHGAGLSVPIGEARILGLAAAGSGTDDTIDLNSLYWTASALQNSPNDARSVVLHELTEGVMGRIGGLGLGGDSWAPMDFFRFTASGQHDYTGGSDHQNTYFSINGSSVYTQLQYHSSYSNGSFDGFDLADWDGVGADANDSDPFGPGGPGVGSPGALSNVDIQIMQALGWGVQSRAIPNDFDGNGTSDLLLESSNGTLADWVVQGGSIVGGHGINNPNAYGYSLVHDTLGLQNAATGDFNGDGTADLLLQNANGTLADWTLQNGMLTGGSSINNPLAYGYHFVTTGDFNGDGTTDLLLQNSSGALAAWTMQNGSLSGGFNLNDPAAYGYQVVGIGDFNGDGTTDLLLQDGSGNLATWIVQNGAVVAGHNDGNPSLYGYHLLTTGDFNGDGTTDLLLQASNGQLTDWIIQNGNVVSGNNASNPGLYGYQVAGIGDYNGDGTMDLLLKNASGNLAYWSLQNGIPTGGAALNNPGSYGYHLAA